MNVKSAVLNAFSLTPTTPPVAKRPLTDPEITQLALALDSWSAEGRSEKRKIADQLLYKAKNGAVKSTIVWDYDLPDTMGSRFVVARAFKSASHAEVERLQDECAKQRDQLPVFKELNLINRCMDLYQATTIDADSPLAMKMVELGARACHLTVRYYVHKGAGLDVSIYDKSARLDVNISTENRTCKLYATSYALCGLLWLPEIAFLKLQVAAQRLFRVAQGAGVDVYFCNMICVRGDHNPAVYGRLSDSDVRHLFPDGKLEFIVQDYERQWQQAPEFHEKALRPRWEELNRQDVANAKQILQAAFPVPAAIVDLAAGYLGS